jgi:hypothetical protein
MKTIKPLEIHVRQAHGGECLGINPEQEYPPFIKAFDDTDGWAHFLSGLTMGDWVVTINDPNNWLNWQTSGRFFVQKGDDSGFVWQTTNPTVRMLRGVWKNDDITLTDEQIEALPRLSIEDVMAHEWAEDIVGLVQWLVDHPEATARVGRWCLILLTPNAEDLIGLSQFDCPVGICTAVEGFDTEKRNDGTTESNPRYTFQASWGFA